MKPVVSKPNPEADRWLMDFWEFWKARPDSESVLSDINNSCAEIFRSNRDSSVSYNSPTEFEGFPAVVQPSIAEHQQLCDKIPGLYHFDPKLMPKALMNSEKSFETEKSFSRFIRALHRLANSSGVGEFVRKHLAEADLKVTCP